MILTPEYSRVAALPDSRNRLKDVPLEDLSYPLRRAFLLMDLENEYKKMSVDEIATAFRENDELLQEKAQRTAEEMIVELNQFLE